MTSLPILYIVVPCYNEEEVLPETTSRLIEVLQNLINQKKIALQSRIMFVDDGSKDRTWEIIQAFNDKQDFVTGLKLARNAGHQNALLAGLMTAKSFSDCVISIDADLQDDVNAIYEFIQKYHEGYDIVYGVRQSRTTDTFFKRFTAESFYRLMKTMGVNLVFNHADYRLMSKRTLENLADFQEVNLFIRGIVPLLGYKSTEVYYDRNERFAGESKYPLKKMLAFAFDGISSFSVTPIRLVTTAGFMIFGLSILAGIYAIIAKILGMTVTGWASIILSVWFLGGVQLIALGLIGEYVGKIYKEVKARPKFIIEKHLTSNNKIQGSLTR
ncbi:glycosyltransferase involved in cell wall biosynthesis [Paenibacillus mucilaginosus]|uniref:glycosyltransferase family 2 protein n=1 Tax=Paenibacillus mucilaginosus TaxID=61624 RepID=UPI003D25A05C